jgi:acyl-CoA thioesterase FadM
MAIEKSKGEKPMPRVRLKPLFDYPFSIDLKVRITDLNYGGHLGNDRLLSLIHEARIAFLAKYGFTELDCGGVSLIMADTAILYQGEAFAGDLLHFQVAADEPTRYGFRMYYRVIRQSDGKAIALVETGMVCFDYQNRKLLTLPDSVKAICNVSA